MEWRQTQRIQPSRRQWQHQELLMRREGHRRQLKMEVKLTFEL
jgi:hypothetical protein